MVKAFSPFRSETRSLSLSICAVRPNLYVCSSFVLVERVCLGKMRLYVCSRKQGSYIASVPLKGLVKLSGYRKRRWEFKDGWLVLEAF